VHKKSRRKEERKIYYRGGINDTRKIQLGTATKKAMRSTE
jgi:hypothetical protein